MDARQSRHRVPPPLSHLVSPHHPSAPSPLYVLACRNTRNEVRPGPSVSPRISIRLVLLHRQVLVSNWVP